MIENGHLIVSERVRIQSKVIDHQMIQGLIIVLFVAISAICSSKLDLGLLSVWPLFILFVIFLRNYELGLICFVLSFAYQAPVIFAPRYGLSAVIRLDEVMFASILPIWFLRMFKGNREATEAPLTKPLLFYVGIAFLSLLPRYGEISSTAFLQTATGLKGLCPLLFKLAQVVVGYLILTDSKLSRQTQNNLFLSLQVVVVFAVGISFLISHGILPKDIVTGSFYDPYGWYTRFSLFGNTGAWGTLLVSYFFILLYSFFYFEPLYIKIPLFISFILCIDSVLMSGTKTSMICLVLGLVFLILKGKAIFGYRTKVVFLALIIIMAGIGSLEYFATEQQKENISYQLGQVYHSFTVENFNPEYPETSLSERFLCWFRHNGPRRQRPWP